MERTIYNPQKGRLETVEIEFEDVNTTWFDKSRRSHEISAITDFNGGLLISVCGYEYPVLIYEESRSSIGYDRNRALQLRRLYLQE